jgi:hypothetical protein
MIFFLFMITKQLFIKLFPTSQTRLVVLDLLLLLLQVVPLDMTVTFLTKSLLSLFSPHFSLGSVALYFETSFRKIFFHLATSLSGQIDVLGSNGKKPTYVLGFVVTLGDFQISTRMKLIMNKILIFIVSLVRKSK